MKKIIYPPFISVITKRFVHIFGPLRGENFFFATDKGFKKTEGDFPCVDRVITCCFFNPLSLSKKIISICQRLFFNFINYNFFFERVPSSFLRPSQLKRNLHTRETLFTLYMRIQISNSRPKYIYYLI